MSAIELWNTTLFYDTSLQGYWRLDDVNDSSTNSYHLTNVNGTTFVAGKFNNGSNHVRASSQYLTIAAASCPKLAIAGSQTWMAWVYLATDTGINRYDIAARADSSSNHNPDLFIAAGNVPKFNVTGLTPAETISTTPIVKLGWNFVCGVWNAATSTKTIWSNSTKKDDTGVTGTVDATASDFSIGRSGGYNSNYTDGIIDEVAIFSRAWSDTEVTNYYNGLVSTRFGAASIFNLMI